MYNTEKYLKKSLDSVCKQTFEDIEVICVNDGSTDGSLSILKEYTKKDKRIKIIDFKENRGASIARNAALKEANGEYVGFVDSDDYLELDFYEKLYKKAIETRADVVKGAYKYKNNYIDILKNEKIKEEQTNFAYEFCSAIYRTSMLRDNNIVFPAELTNLEDNIFAFKVSTVANKIEIVDEAHINITERKGSLSREPFSDSKINHIFDNIQIMVKLVNEAKAAKESKAFTLARLTYIWVSRFEAEELTAQRFLEIYLQVEDKENFKKEIDKIAFNRYCSISKYLENGNAKKLHIYLKNYCAINPINRTRIKIKNLTSKNTEKILELKNKHLNKRCFIIGNSPSLNQLDISKLNEEYTFTVNKGYKLAEKGLSHSNFHCISDEALLEVDGIDNEMPVDFADTYFVWSVIDFNKFEADTVYFDYTPEGNFQEDLTKPLWAFHTVIAYAIQIAFYMGFKDIYLIGVDWDFKNYSGYSYQAASEEKKRQIEISVADKPSVINGLQNSYEYLKKKRVNLYNASPAGSINCMPRIDYEQLFKEKANAC